MQERHEETARPAQEAPSASCVGDRRPEEEDATREEAPVQGHACTVTFSFEPHNSNVLVLCMAK